MIIAIPSKGRAGKVKSQEYITSASVFVPEIEADLYTRLGAKNVVAVPDSVKGITQTRNWILDHVQDRHVVFIDDDLKAAGWTHLYSHHVKHETITEAQMLAEWQKLFEIIEALGYRIWGLSTETSPRSVYPWKPFLFHTYVTASCMGMINEPRTRFDESFPVKEDYELCLRCIKEDGGVLGARYLDWMNEHWVGEGGCKKYRTQKMERDAIARLMQMYPGLIRRITRGGSEYSIELDF